MVAHHLWSSVFRNLGFLGLYQSIIDLLAGWRNWMGMHSLDNWNLVPSCLMWSIWRVCNNRTFKDLEGWGDQLLASVVGTLFDCSQVWAFIFSDSIPMFLDFLSYCE